MQTGSPVQVRRPDQPSMSSISELGGLAPEVLQYGHLNLPHECMEILKEAKRPSTRHFYTFKWKRFCVWCVQHQYDPMSCQEDVVLLSLLHLVRSGLSLSTIQVHLAAITAYQNSPEQALFFTIAVIKDFLEVLKKVFPPIRSPSPPWELNIVLSKLMGPPFEPIHKSTLQHLTWKAAFLVAITSARRVREIQALCTHEPYTVFHSSKVVMRTHPSFFPHGGIRLSC